MADRPHAFTQQAARRVVAATRKVEAMQPRAGGGASAGALHQRTSFDVEIVGETDGAYSWKKLVVTNGQLAPADPPVNSDGFSARDRNDAEGIPAGTRVTVEFVGYDAENDNKPCYLFSYGGSGSPRKWIRITGYTAVTGKTNRWRYAWIESRPVQDGDWEDVPDGATSGAAGFAYNTIEANNSDTGIQGNSVNVTTLPTGYSIQPVQGNPIVRAEPIANCNDVIEWHFSYENGISNPEGSCD